jgi:hypothetical protein
VTSDAKIRSGETQLVHCHVEHSETSPSGETQLVHCHVERSFTPSMESQCFAARERNFVQHDKDFAMAY